MRSHTFHFAYCFVLWLQHHVSADNATESYRVTGILLTFLVIPHVSSKCPATLLSLLNGLITQYSVYSLLSGLELSVQYAVL